MDNQRITEADRQMACKRAQYTNEKFRYVLRADLERCLGVKRHVPIEEFVEFFDRENVKRGHKRLDTHNVKYAAYFEALPDVCTIDDEHRFISRRKRAQNSEYTQLRERTRSQPPSAKPPTSRQVSRESQVVVQRERSLSLSPTLEMTRRGQRAPALQPPAVKGSDLSRDLTITDVLHTLVAFTHTLSGKMLTWQEYLEQLEVYNEAASKRFPILRSDRLKFVREDVSGSKNKVEVASSGTSTTLSISECSCCRSRSQSPVDDDTKSEKDAAAFSFAMGSFKKVKMELTSHEVRVVDTDAQRRKLGLHFILENQDFRDLHEELRTHYRNNEQTIADIEVGMVCVVPFKGTKDYHRGIVKDISDPSTPVVFYIDLGIEQGVANGCLRRFNDDFYYRPTFCLAGEVRDSPPYEERVHLANKLRKKKKVILKAEEYDRIKGRYIVTLDTDSGIISDAN